MIEEINKEIEEELNDRVVLIPFARDEDDTDTYDVEMLNKEEVFIEVRKILNKYKNIDKILSEIDIYKTNHLPEDVEFVICMKEGLFKINDVNDFKKYKLMWKEFYEFTQYNAVSNITGKMRDLEQKYEVKDD